jgi:hypothetical protein
MSDFIVLGLIPGTQTELTFTFWLAIASLLAGGVCGRSMWRTHATRAAIITIRMVLAVRRPLVFWSATLQTPRAQYFRRTV